MMNNTSLIQSLKEVCSFLNEAEMEYILVGGLAVGIWAEPRATTDIDFLISVSFNDSDFLREKLVESGRFLFVREKPMIFRKISLLRASLKDNPDTPLSITMSIR
jgi:hypothetical protein